MPLLLLVIYPPFDDRGFWLDFSVALGFIGLAMMALQFALTAGINRIEASYGIDIILQFHRYISIVAVAFILRFMLKKPYLVEQVRPERGDVCTLTLRPIGHPGFLFQPGQFAWITLEISPYRMREHPFSMSSIGDRTDIIAFSIKALGDFTNTIKDVKSGTKAYLDSPYGVFTTDRYEDSAGFVLIAGGIGITPMMSMLLTAVERKDERPYLLIYASKSWDDITFGEELDELKAELNLTIVPVLRNPPEDWSGETGYVDKELLERYIPERRGTRNYFICAAPKMMDAVEEALHKLDVPVTNVHLEHFNLV